MTKNIILPKRKPSKLICIGIKDLKAAEKIGARIDMGNWFFKREEGGRVRCSVCFAGGVMKGTLGMKPRTYIQDVSPNEDDTPGNVNQLVALNEFRSGCIRDGLRLLGFSDKRIDKLPAKWRDTMNVCPFWKNDKLFYRDMQQMARRLAYHGL